MTTILAFITLCEHQKTFRKLLWATGKKEMCPPNLKAIAGPQMTSRWRNNPFYREQESLSLSRKSPEMESFSLLINSSCTKHIKPLLATASKPITRSCNNCVRVMIRLLYTMSDFLNQKGPWLSGPIPVFNNQGD